LIWKSRKEFDVELNEYVQVGYCEGDCPQNLSKITEGSVELCPDLSDSANIQEDSDERLEAEYERIDNEIPTMEDIDIGFINSSFSEQDNIESEELATVARLLDVENLLRIYREYLLTITPTPTPTPTQTIGGS
jgi:hypothetical protein